MIYLRQSTASQEVPLGPFWDDLDGVTAETGLTIANTDIKVWKAGTTTLANKNSGGGTHISGGIYSAVLDATDTDTVGSGCLYVKVAGALGIRQEFCVLAANVYDSLIAGSASLLVEPASASITAAKFAANAIDAGALATDAVTEIQSGLATAASIAALNDLSAADVGGAVAVELASYGAAVPGDIPTANAVADALLDRANAVDTYTPRQILRVLAAVLAGEITFAGNTATVSAIDGSKTRVTSETDAQEQRTNITVDAA
jgi:hypothetical protein